MQKKSILIAGQHATSISLEDEFFDELKAIADEKKTSLNKLITEIDKTRKISNLSSAIRVYILLHLKNKLTTPK